MGLLAVAHLLHPHGARTAALVVQWLALALALPFAWSRACELKATGGWRSMLQFALGLLLLAALVAPALRPVLRPPATIPLAPAAPLMAFALAWLLRKSPIPKSLSAFLERRHPLLPVLVPGIVLTVCATTPEVLAYWDASGWKDSTSYDAAAHAIATGTNLFGSSYYMPLYQYGTGLLYYLFGHQFWVQQVANLLLACATSLLLPLAAWNLFRSRRATLMTGLWVAFTWQLHHAPFSLQIENWYIPAMSLVIWCWSRYRLDPSTRWAVLFGAALGMALNIRSQGVFCFAALCLAPLFLPGIPKRKALAQVALIGMVVAVTLVPWALRNYHVSDRFSPTSEQATLQLAVLNDPRVAFYGIRYDINYSQLVSEYTTTYPDPKERAAALQASIRNNFLSDPEYTLKATWWRTLAYYGMLPPGVWAPAGPEPTQWTAGVAVRWLYIILPSAFAIIFALGGLLLRPGRTTWFLLLAMLGNWCLVILVGSGEPRISYPALPMHFLLGLHAFFRPSSLPLPARTAVSLKRVAAILGILLCTGIAARHFVGAPHACATLNVTDLHLSSETTVRMPSPMESALPEKGSPVILEATVSANMFPPKYMQGLHDHRIPEFALAPDQPTFYVVAEPSGMAAVVSYAGAEANMPLREGDRVRIDGTVLDLLPESAPSILWLRSNRIQVLEHNCP